MFNLLFNAIVVELYNYASRGSAIPGPGQGIGCTREGRPGRASAVLAVTGQGCSSTRAGVQLYQGRGAAVPGQGCSCTGVKISD